MKIIIVILTMFLMLELYGCGQKSPKIISLKDILEKNQENFIEFLDIGLCQDVPKYIKTRQSIYFIRSCKKLVENTYSLELYLPKKYRYRNRHKIFAKLFLKEISQKYCNTFQGEFGEDAYYLEYLLKNTEFFDFYLKKIEEKEKKIRSMQMPGYYKKRFLEVFLGSITLPQRYNIYCIFPRKSLFLSYESSSDVYDSVSINVKIKEVNSKALIDIINNSVERAFSETKQRILSMIEEDKREIFWYGTNLPKNERGVILEKLTFNKGWRGELKLYITVINKSNKPYTFDLSVMSLFKDGKQYPIFYKIDPMNKEIIGVYESGDCDRIFGNKIIIPPDGKCSITYSEIKISGLSDLDGAAVGIDGFSFLVPIKKISEYERKVKSLDI